MVLLENVHSAVTEIRANMFRSVLTVLGIVIAVMAVISVVSILQGMSLYITEFIQGMGSDAMWVVPYQPPGRAGSELGRIELTYDDAQAIYLSCPQIKKTAPLLQASAELVLGNSSCTSSVIGTSSDFPEIRNWYVDAGRYFSELDMRHRKNVCVIGREVLRKLGAAETLVGQPIRLNDRQFHVVGLLERKGSFFGQSQDDIVLIPFPTAEKIYGNDLARHISILCQVYDSEMTKEASALMKEILRKRHRLEEKQPDDFQISTQDQILEFFNKATKITTVVLAGIVGISLLVGGIGIMNIMLVSVTERTREIGVLKALGARPKDILAQFLVEAILLSLFGGILGVILGFAVGFGVSALSPLPRAFVPLWAVVLSLVFSGAVGVFFGMYPAIKAARLNPIDALRWE
ncbi:MAG: ABC transporter permease [Planctomycetes bacterium]|nr:ABC transporter permease [Planctomycetota bacterium]